MLPVTIARHLAVLHPCMLAIHAEVLAAVGLAWLDWSDERRKVG
jgi:hypothetical protein